MNQILAQRLRIARERKNLKQVEVMQMTMINNKRLSGYENGTSEPDIDTLKILAEVYDVTIDWLSGRDTNISKHNSIVNESDFDEWMNLYLTSSPKERKLILEHASVTLDMIRRWQNRYL